MSNLTTTIQAFQFDESANSPDLTDEEIASAIVTSNNEDAILHLGQDCVRCGEPFHIVRAKKLFRFPHFYSRMGLECSQGHKETKLFQVTWLYKKT